jgi:hypothetical protein
MVRNGRSGWLAARVSADSLREALELAIKEICGGNSMSDECRKFAESEYSMSLQAKRYIALFSEIITKTDRLKLAKAPMTGAKT